MLLQLATAFFLDGKEDFWGFLKRFEAKCTLMCQAWCAIYWQTLLLAQMVSFRWFLGIQLNTSQVKLQKRHHGRRDAVDLHRILMVFWEHARAYINWYQLEIWTFPRQIAKSCQQAPFLFASQCPKSKWPVSIDFFKGKFVRNHGFQTQMQGFPGKFFP